jgi:enoyl-CoA hydratase/carnithine racemase
LIGVARAKQLVASGQFINSKIAYAFGLVDAVIDPVFDWRELAEVSLDKAQAGRVEETPEELEFAAFDGEFNHPLLAREGFEKQAKGITRKAPVALKTAMSLIDQGSGLDLQDGLQLELDSLTAIFATQDARTGLESILSGQKPNYVGK